MLPSLSPPPPSLIPLPSSFIIIINIITHLFFIVFHRGKFARHERSGISYEYEENYAKIRSIQR
jgi:hypothetical protein